MKKLGEYMVGDVAESYVLIQQATVKMDKNGNEFIDFVLQDKTQWITAKLWHANQEAKEQFITGAVIRIRGKREVYKNRPQMRLLDIRLTTEDEPNDPELYKSAMDIQTSEVENDIQSYVQAIKQPLWRTIVEESLKAYHDDFYRYPAAQRHHHAFKGGLAYHTMTMLHLAEAYTTLYENLNRELLYAGVILHDMGKIEELSITDETTYTLAGNLCGHIVMMDEWIMQIALEHGYDKNDEALLLLKHMILAHHGKKEYGSPVEPQILEAEVLNMIDSNDASIQMMTDALAHTEYGQYTMPIAGCNQRSLYRYKTMQ